MYPSRLLHLSSTILLLGKKGKDEASPISQLPSRMAVQRKIEERIWYSGSKLALDTVNSPSPSWPAKLFVCS